MGYNPLETNAVKIITDELVKDAPTVASARATQTGYHIDNVRDGQRGSVWEANWAGNTGLYMQYASAQSFDCAGVFNHNAGGYSVRVMTGESGSWDAYFLEITCPDGDFMIWFPAKSSKGLRMNFLAVADLRIGQYQVGTLFNFTYGVARPFAGIHNSNSVIASTPAHIDHRENRGRQYENWDIPMPSIRSTTRDAWSDLWDEKNAGLHAAGVAFDEGTEVSADHFLYETVILTTIADNFYREGERFKNTFWESQMKLHEVI